MSNAPASKLAKHPTQRGAETRAKRRFNNGKKRLTGGVADNAHARRAECSKSSADQRAGTRRAVKGKELSPAGPAIPNAPHSNKIEGNRRGRRSTSLRLAEVRNIMAAAVFTAQEHRALNRHTTVHFGAAGIADPVAALRAYMKLARDWLRTQGARFAYIWVRESGEGKGEHAHILMHVPASLVAQFARRERGWRKRIGAKPARGAFRSTAIGRSYRHAEVGIQYGELYRDALDGVVGYLAKGAEPRAVAVLNLEKVQRGGELWGKRSGMSENIGRTARDRFRLLK